jgi:protein dithiol oxidoreductase (disulfide-forming)
MLKKATQISLLALLFIFSGVLKAEPVGYEIITPAQPTHDPAKIEVIEFFWYGCPHCYDFEPLLNKWKETIPKNVEFIRIPAAFSETWTKHAKAYYTAEALGVLDKVHADFFEAIQKRNEELETEEQLAKFFVSHGVKEADFHEAYNSFPVDAKIRQAPGMGARYGITGVPAIIVNGKYKTNGKIAGSHEKMIEVMNQLIEQESGKK